MSQRRRYNPNRSSDWNYGGVKWKLSRSKIDLFLECPRCFYLDNVLGTARPRGPSFTLNIAVDELLKREFDTYRERQEPHPIMERYELDMLPYADERLEVWRDPFAGLQHLHEETGLLISGAVDDLWETPEGHVVVVDYKATAKEGTITTLADSSWEEQYRRQLGVYQWLLAREGFSVHPTAYFVYANADARRPEFADRLEFETTLIPCTGSTDWIETTLTDIKRCLEQTTLPPVGEQCEYCAYRDAAGRKSLAIHNANKRSAS